VSAELALAAAGIAAASGGPALFLPRTSGTGQRVAAALQLLAAVLGAAGAVLAIARGEGAPIRATLSPLCPTLTLGLDALSAVFLLPVCLLSACAAVFDLGYWRQAEHPHDGRQLRVFAGLLTGSLIALLLAKDAIAFLMAWEVMALAAFFLVAVDKRQPDARGASWIYLACTHAATLLLFAFFCLWDAATGSFLLVPQDPVALAAPGRDTLFLLALAGFGIKAGVVPLHFWLPPAHACAPSHVSALMSGVLIKMGVYGVARTVWLLPEPPPWWGLLLLAIGGVSAVVGVTLAIGQHDLKRLLAYHSVENIGIIFLGLGLAVLGRATNRAEWIVLGLGGALLHVWNHGVFKGLLFLAAGATIHGTRTREIDQLGGVAREMPWTAACFLVGAVAICGLPPLNGFVSELVLYLGLFHSLRDGPAVAIASALAIPALAIAGALALLCFVKVFGVAFLGTPRSDAVRQAHEVGLAMRLPMLVLAAACAAIGIAPVLVTAPLQAVAADWVHKDAALPALGDLAPLRWITVLALVLCGGAAIVLSWLRARRTRATRSIGTWDCGYVRIVPTMQYTASSFAAQFVGLAAWLLRPRAARPAQDSLFPRPQRFHSEVSDLVLDGFLLSALRGLGFACNWLRLLQRGRVQIYVLYVFVTLLVLLLLG